MPIRLTPAERKTAKQFADIKKKSGSHSPSPAMLAGVKGIKVKYDFCYLSNPHATELFLKLFKKDSNKREGLRKFIERYPSQNRSLAEKFERSVGVPAANIFVGNGATEIIQAVLQNFVEPVGVKLPHSRRSLTPTSKILVPVPTFSPYLEFVLENVRVIPHQLNKKDDFRLDTNALLTQIKKEKPDTVVLINPNNPDGGYLNTNELRLLLGTLREVETVIVDESFIHFAEDADVRRLKGADKRELHFPSYGGLVKKYPNLIVIKSLSKDFGIAGLRLGYAVMSEKRVSELLSRGYLWNVSGFGEYFLDLLNRKDFLKEYEHARLRAIRERDDFFRELSRIKGLKVYPSKANMFLVELLDGSRAEDLTVALLCRYGLYIRLCKDKVGLMGEFIRVASRTAKENTKLAQVLRLALSE